MLSRLALKIVVGAREQGTLNWEQEESFGRFYFSSHTFKFFSSPTYIDNYFVTLSPYGLLKAGFLINSSSVRLRKNASKSCFSHSLNLNPLINSLLKGFVLPIPASSC